MTTCLCGDRLQFVALQSHKQKENMLKNRGGNPTITRTGPNHLTSNALICFSIFSDVTAALRRFRMSSITVILCHSVEFSLTVCKNRSNESIYGCSSRIFRSTSFRVCTVLR